VRAPEALSQTVAVRFDDATFARLSGIAEQTFRTPSALVRDWVLERLSVVPLPGEPVAAAGPTAAPRTPGPSGQVDEREQLRRRFRPDDVVVLLVGESAPAGGTFFYQADSHLFSATRDAFERAMGPMPAGTAFLEIFAEMGFWLYDMVEEPVNRKRGRPRRHAVSAGVTELKLLIEELEPDFVVAVKTSLEGPVRQAAQLAGFPASRLRILPFPLYQWREEYVQELAKFLGHKRPSPPEVDPLPQPERLTLHEAMEVVLHGRGGGPMPARQLANEIAERGLYQRLDGGRADYQQLLSRAKKYTEQFSVGQSGIALKAGPDVVRR
jgi:hypothetical protein